MPVSQPTTGAGKILIVDDEEPTRRMLGRLLEGYGYTCLLAGDALEARQRLNQEEFVLILCDMNMPGESGLELVRHVLNTYPHTAAVMVTGLDDPQLANIALEIGAYGYIIKPFEANEVLINVANALRRRRLEIENKAHREKLEQTVFERTSALRQAIRSLEEAQKGLRLSREETIQRLAIAAEFRDNATAQHIRRMSSYCEVLARRYGLDAERCELIRIASPMHDIGKIGTPDHILLKPGAFTPEEFETITRHTNMGYRILEGSEAELLKLAAMIALTHHEKFDGTGYPRRLAGESIPIEGRIAAIADAFDALTSKRVYKPAMPPEQATDIMRKDRGKHFDPDLLDVFLDSMDDVLKIRDQYTDSAGAA
jgi:putative two-component system response regulator